jgi:ribulose-phosphate 3-epimerase
VEKPMALIAPSILSADFGKIGEEVRELEFAGADMIHCDVMDGVFVPNITFGMGVIAAVRKRTGLPLDVHLMIEKPERYVEQFIDAGADIITFHTTATTETESIIKTVKNRGKQVGIALNPDIGLHEVKPYLDVLDLVLIMSVYAGFGGQKFIPKSLEKISELRYSMPQGKRPLIEVDGGVNLENFQSIKSAGADILVAGNLIYQSPNKSDTISMLRG